MTTKNKDKEYVFTATGGWTINSDLIPVYDAFNQVVGFQLPDGRLAQLVIALEIVDEKTDSFKYITSEKQMERLGFCCLDYDRLVFEETNNRYAEEV